MFTVCISGIEFYGYHGVSSEERKVGHRFRADLEVLVDGRADQTDELSDTIDYGALADLVAQVSDGQKHRTIERLALLIAKRVIEDFAIAREVRVTLAKLLPPLAHVVEEAAVELLLTRS